MRLLRLIPVLALSIYSVQAASVTVALVASPSPAAFGGLVRLTATPTPSQATGKVTFYDGVTVLGIAPVSSGSAVLNTYALAAGSRSLRAYYTGDGTYSPAASATSRSSTFSARSSAA